MTRPMKDSGIEWIGKIPDTWKIDKIKHRFSVISGATPRSENNTFWDGEIPWITPADYKTQEKYVTRGKRNLTLEGYNSCGTTLVPAGSIIFSKRAPVGTVALAQNELCTNQGCLSCVVKDNSNTTFYFYALSVFTEQFELVSTGTTFKEIAADVFSNFTLPRPDVAEQSRIAAYLDDKCGAIDALIDQTHASIEEYKKLKQAVITRAVTKGIRPGRKMKDSGIEWVGEIPEEWACRKFKHVACVKSNLVSPENYLDYPQISPENIEKGSGKLLPCRTVAEVGIISGNHLFFKGQILYSKIRPKLNKVIIAPFNGLCSADMYPIETKLNARFFLYSLRSDFFLANISLITEDRVKMPKINQEELAEIYFAVPALVEQQEIAAYLDDKCAAIDSLIGKKERFASELDNYKKSMIFEYVTGKKEVTE